jgi:[glutamine synthetase] adenylyltransferase / [glutamine synthetase]-adenylyl-L-tyrosine phosphorylase
MKDLELLLRDLPDPEGARRFYEHFSERNAAAAGRLARNAGLYSDVLTLASFSPLLAGTLIQHPEYVAWLERSRRDPRFGTKDELMESLARFSLTEGEVTPNVVYARFRRRELLRIFLQDIRRTRTVAEITEQISELADAVLENALRHARQEMDNRYGAPLEEDDKGKKRPSDICIVSLGKLGSKELNYSSDIDLMFIYSGDGRTAGGGARGAVTNREYFVKLTETVTRLVGSPADEGAAYRVDLRLRPHGRVGPITLSLGETRRYYLTQARAWERQVLIRSRPSAGSAEIYRNFFTAVEEEVFAPGRSVTETLESVYRSKELINEGLSDSGSFDVKLGRGGIREIEFIAQALQLAYGGSDRWLRVPHTLVSIARLAERGHITDGERSALAGAYDFLRRLEHVLQMEHGLQTHLLPREVEKVDLISRKMGYSRESEFAAVLEGHTSSVHQIFTRIFSKNLHGGHESGRPQPGDRGAGLDDLITESGTKGPQAAFLEAPLSSSRSREISHAAEVSPKFAEFIAARPWLCSEPATSKNEKQEPDYDLILAQEVDSSNRTSMIRSLRVAWSRQMLNIMLADIFQTEPVGTIRARQSRLAEAVMRSVIAYLVPPDHRGRPIILAFGKLGGAALDYDSDLDLIFAHTSTENEPPGPDLSEIIGRVVESFLTLVSGITREGNLYRVDLRLRPYGRNGPNSSSVFGLVEYLQKKASVWELLAYTQVRAIPGISDLAEAAEQRIRKAIRARAKNEDREHIIRSTLEMRQKLGESRGRVGGRDLDFKYGPGGQLDIYFAVRCLLLLHPDLIMDRTRGTSEKLAALLAAGALTEDAHAALAEGHRFLSSLDHEIRLAVGRTSRLPRSNQPVLERIAHRMQFASTQDLLGSIALHLAEIRRAFLISLQH